MPGEARPAPEGLVREHREHVRYCDQYALNILFSEKWRPLDPRWNQNSNLWVWGGPHEGAFSQDLFWTLRNDPWIVHFTWLTKPWHYGCTHPYTRKFFQVVDRTAWRLQTRWFAHHGRSVLAVDFPAHGWSAGPMLTSVAAMADHGNSAVGRGENIGRESQRQP